jgi:hypothetical protein
MLIRSHIALFHGILGVPLIAKDAKGYAIQALVIAPNDGLEQFGIAGQNA